MNTREKWILIEMVHKRWMPGKLTENDESVYFETKGADMEWRPILIQRWIKYVIFHTY